jgi:hypothetical protein
MQCLNSASLPARRLLIAYLVVPVSYAPAMNPSTVSLFCIPAILLYKDG